MAQMHRYWFQFCAIASLLMAAHTSAAIDSMASPFPQAQVRSGSNEAPAIVVNGTPYYPLFFSPANGLGQEDVLLEQIRRARESGVTLFTINLPATATPAEVSGILTRFCGPNPSCYFIVRTRLDPSTEWLQSNPAESLQGEDGTSLPLASPSSLAWRSYLKSNLSDLITAIERTSFARQIIGVSLECMEQGIWEYPQTDTFIDYSPAAKNGFAEWLKDTYNDESALVASWQQPGLTWTTARVPTGTERTAADWGVFRDPVRDRASIDFQRFLSESIAVAIADFADHVKQRTSRRLLVGVPYGFQLESKQTSKTSFANTGHLALNRVLACEDIDFIVSPLANFERRSTLPGHFVQAIDSVALHGKLAIIEDDTVTHLSAPPIESTTLVPLEQTHSLMETISVTRRNAGLFMMHRAGYWYTDRAALGNWNDDGFWQSTALLRRLGAESREYGPYAPEIAFVISEDSQSVMSASAHPVLYQSLSAWRSELDRIGSPVGYYLQSDLPILPKSVKLLILANPYVMTRDERRSIDARVKAGTTVLYTYAPDILGPNGVKLSRLDEITGMLITTRSDNTPMVFSSVQTDESFTVDEETWSPRLVIEGNDLHVLAQYAVTEEVAVAARPSGKGAVVYSAVPNLPTRLLRWIARTSGVHLYSDEPAALSVMGPYLVLHPENSGEAGFTWPEQFTKSERIAPVARMTVAERTKGWKDNLSSGVTMIYRVETSKRVPNGKSGGLIGK